MADVVTLHHRVSPGEATSPRPGAHPTTGTRPSVRCQPGFDTQPSTRTGAWSTPGPAGSAAQWALYRAATTPDYGRWLEHVRPAAGCTRPIRLVGQVATIDSDGRLLAQQSTQDMPDGVIYKPCGNRRHTVCPSCAETYRRDAYQLIRAGLVGGKGVPDTVAAHPAVFATFTAPGFGLVHTRRTAADGRVLACRPRRLPDPCRHGVDLRCHRLHMAEEKTLGQPLCLDCYDHPHQVVFNYHAGELWRRTTIAIVRQLRRTARTRGIHPNSIRLSFGKVAEMQRRGVVHYHAIIRLDGVDPTDPTAILPPPPGLSVADLVAAVEHAAAGTGFRTETHPANPTGWPITWGTQLDIRPVTVHGHGDISDQMVAGYLAKYATKSTEITGHLSGRLTPDTIEQHADPDGTHTQRLINACWTLGTPKAWRGLRRWAHMLGFGGHFLTKSRRFSVTFRLLRDRRIIWRRTEAVEIAEHHDEQTTLIIGLLSFAGAGWHTTGDALLANTSADLARHRHQTAREELTYHATTAQVS